MQWETVRGRGAGYARQVCGEYTVSVAKETGGSWRFLLSRYNRDRIDLRDWLGTYETGAAAKQAAAEHAKQGAAKS